ncbi:unnamed protein product [Ranitomeya imitator]|uniref:SAM domain-containing protein n=1 Tax=Ranitomeya imitator TaxID=111125 RepID=A0ABN9MGE2_9NEOB|nr:unnamed protein product [Ranitomeya imitator]
MCDVAVSWIAISLCLTRSSDLDPAVTSLVVARSPELYLVARSACIVVFAIKSNDASNVFTWSMNDKLFSHVILDLTDCPPCYSRSSICTVSVKTMANNSQLCIRRWTTKHVAKWLREEGFCDYVDILCNKHRLDGTALLALTEYDLRSPPLEIKVLGDIKRLMLSIRKLQKQHASVLEELGLGNEPASGTLSVSSPPNPDWLCNGELKRDFDGHGTDSSVEPHQYSNGKHKYPPKRLDPEYWKTAISCIYVFIVFGFTSFIMVIVHERVPDMQTYPPLPDIFLDSTGDLSSSIGQGRPRTHTAPETPAGHPRRALGSSAGHPQHCRTPLHPSLRLAATVSTCISDAFSTAHVRLKPRPLLPGHYNGAADVLKNCIRCPRCAFLFTTVLHLFLYWNSQVKSAQKTLEIRCKSSAFYLRMFQKESQMTLLPFLALPYAQTVVYFHMRYRCTQEKLPNKF